MNLKVYYVAPVTIVQELKLTDAILEASGPANLNVFYGEEDW